MKRMKRWFEGVVASEVVAVLVLVVMDFLFFLGLEGLVAFAVEGVSGLVVVVDGSERETKSSLVARPSGAVVVVTSSLSKGSGTALGITPTLFFLERRSDLACLAAALDFASFEPLVLFSTTRVLRGESAATSSTSERLRLDISNDGNESALWPVVHYVVGGGIWLGYCNARSTGGK